MSQPVVTVVCLCYNHERYVKEALESVFNQTYPAIQLIVVDDASGDNSVSVIREILKEKPDAVFIRHEQNSGNCSSFNEALRHAHGEYIVDLAADDVLLPERIQEGVEAFARNPGSGVTFCDALYIDSNSAVIGRHYKRDGKGRLVQVPPSGYVYKDVLERYFICPPTIMFSRKAILDLGGYDEKLAYEDFDFLVRAARKFPFTFTDRVLVKKRTLKNSLSSRQYAPDSKILHSTYLVCEKAYALNKTPEERKALLKRVIYEVRQALLSKNPAAADKFAGLLQKLEANGLQAKFLIWAAKNHIDLSMLNPDYYRQVNRARRDS